MPLSLGLGRLALLALAGLGAGAVNALAGGGTLITFPSLTSLGVLPVLASATNTVALSPGYLGATFAQRADLRAQGKRLAWLLPAAVLGGLVGGALLLHTSERMFRGLVPFLILGAAGLLAVQERLRAWLVARLARRGRPAPGEAWAVPAVFAASVYGGYFGAGLSVIVLAVLALLLDDSLTRLNALKQALAAGVNVAAAAFFVVTGHVAWPAAAAVAVGAVLGGLVGGRLAGRVRPAVLRAVVVVAGLTVGLAYLLG